MILLIRSEFLKLRSVRSNLTMAAAAFSLPIAGTVLLSMFSGMNHIDERAIPDMITGSGNVSVLICGIVGVLCITQEYSQGTIRLTIAATFPDGVELQFGRVGAISYFGIWVAAATCLACLNISRRDA